jgi:hypothetical protein
MLLLSFIPFGLLIGFLSGGTLSNLGNLKLRWLPLVFPSLAIQWLIFPLFSGSALISVGNEALHLLSYALLAVWIVINVRVLPIALVGAGAACNFAALVANGGLMPASSEAIQRAGLVNLADVLVQEGSYANLVLMSPDTHLNALGDILFVPEWIPFSTAFSIGDVLIMLALGWLIVRGMRSHA